MTQTDALVVLIACPTGEPADALARSLVEAGLAACVNRLPGMRSTYRWQGEVVTDEEDLLLAKTTSGAYPALQAFVAARHPYEVPEIVALPVSAGHALYLDWLRANVAASESGVARS